jgi:hypothetical protein
MSGPGGPMSASARIRFGDLLSGDGEASAGTGLSAKICESFAQKRLVLFELATWTISVSSGKSAQSPQPSTTTR